MFSMMLTGQPFRLVLVGPVTHAEFDAPRNEGSIPKPASGWRKLGGRGWAHSAG
jgi:hypothetical protein